MLEYNVVFYAILVLIEYLLLFFKQYRTRIKISRGGFQNSHICSNCFLLLLIKSVLITVRAVFLLHNLIFTSIQDILE